MCSTSGWFLGFTYDWTVLLLPHPMIDVNLKFGCPLNAGNLRKLYGVILFPGSKVELGKSLSFTLLFQCLNFQQWSQNRKQKSLFALLLQCVSLLSFFAVQVQWTTSARLPRSKWMRSMHAVICVRTDECTVNTRTLNDWISLARLMSVSVSSILRKSMYCSVKPFCKPGLKWTKSREKLVFLTSPTLALPIKPF